MSFTGFSVPPIAYKRGAVTASRIAFLVASLDLITAIKVEDDELFPELLETSLQAGLREEEITGCTGLPIGLFRTWVSGEILPSVRERRLVGGHIVGLIRNKIKELEPRREGA